MSGWEVSRGPAHFPPFTQMRRESQHERGVPSKKGCISTGFNILLRSSSQKACLPHMPFCEKQAGSLESWGRRPCVICKQSTPKFWHLLNKTTQSSAICVLKESLNHFTYHLKKAVKIWRKLCFNCSLKQKHFWRREENQLAPGNDTTFENFLQLSFPKERKFLKFFSIFLLSKEKSCVSDGTPDSQGWHIFLARSKRRKWVMTSLWERPEKEVKSAVTFRRQRKRHFQRRKNFFQGEEKQPQAKKEIRSKFLLQKKKLFFLLHRIWFLSKTQRVKDSEAFVLLVQASHIDKRF